MALTRTGDLTWRVYPPNPTSVTPAGEPVEEVAVRGGAEWARYGFRLFLFADRTDNVGLVDFRLRFAAGGAVAAECEATAYNIAFSTNKALPEHVPAEPVTATAKAWVKVAFAGTVRGDFTAVDSVDLLATTTEGYEVQFHISDRFAEPAKAR